MNTLSKNKNAQARATNVRFVHGMLYIALNDGREIGLSLTRTKWLKWLAKATPKQRRKWSIDRWGETVYWEDLDDGIEVCHLLTPLSLAE